jgi:uncharacterized protein
LAPDILPDGATVTGGMDPVSILAILAALCLGGILKGATGAGTPVVAVPVIAAFLDVRTAVIIMVVPNLATNIWQQWQFRKHRLPNRFAAIYAAAGGVGALIGTTMLAVLPAKTLSLLLVAAVFAYVALRLARPAFQLAIEHASRIVLPMGIAGGILQGAAGISAPVTISFLNAMRLERPVFIATISAYFAVMTIMQIATMFAYGMLTPHLLGLGAAALIPILATIPLGAWIARHMSAQLFDRVILVLLTLLALRMLFGALFEPNLH